MSELPPWLAPAVAYIHRWLEHQMRVSEQPGCEVAVAYRGQIVLDVALGLADLTTGEALTPRHRFRVASHSKAFTATAFLKLRDSGLVGLDDRLGKFVAGLHPELANATVAQLLSHSAGLTRDGVDSGYTSGRGEFPTAHRLRADFVAAPIIPASTRFKYSNHGYGLAGLIIEGLVDEPYDVWMQREIIDPAGLAHTTPEINATAARSLASGHSGKSLLGRRQVFRGDESTRALAPAGGFVSTASDLCRFFAQLSPVSATSLLSVAGRREMTRRLWRDPYGKDEECYGLGLFLGSYGEWQWFGHAGGHLGYITKTTVVPAEDLTVSVLTNAVDGKAHEWVQGALAILQRFRRAPAGSAIPTEWSGRWWNAWGPIDLVQIGDRVILASPESGDPLAYAPELVVDAPDVARIIECGGYHRFGETVHLLRDADGSVCAVKIGGDTWVRESALREELIARYSG